MGIEAMKDVEYFNETISKIIATRTRVTNELRSLGFEVLDSQTNFIMATHSDYDMKEMFEYLKENKIFIRYFNLPRINKYVRITIGTDEEMDKFLNGVKNFINR